MAPPSKLTPSNIPAVIPASTWPTLVTVTMLSGFVGLTAMASSDSFRCRWLTSTLVGVVLAAIADPAGISSAAVTAATAKTANPERAIPIPYPLGVKTTATPHLR